MTSYAIVTGASRGIGKSLALQLAKKGHHLILISRSATELNSLSDLIEQSYNVKALTFSCDLSDPKAISKLISWITGLNVPINILINNAGYGLWGQFSELPLEAQLQMLSLNVNAVVSLTHQLLPLLALQQRSYIMNISSTAAYQAVPTLALYSASKAAVLSFTRALRYELRQGPVSISCLSPGPTDTGFAHRAGMDQLADLAKKFNMQPDEVAQIALRGMFAGKAEIIPGFLNKLSAFAVRLVSKNVVERISGRIYDN